MDALLAEAMSWDDRELAADPGLLTALDELRTGIMTTVRPRRRLRFGSNQMMLAAAFATALVIFGAAALSRSTPERPSAPPTQQSSPKPTPGPLHKDSGKGTLFNLCNPELPATIDGLGQGYPLPAGGDWSYLKAELPRLCGNRSERWLGYLDLATRLQRVAVCQWEYLVLDLDQRRDAAIGNAWKGFREVASRTYIGPDGKGRYTRHTVTFGTHGILGQPGSWETISSIRQDVQRSCTPAMGPAGVAK